MRRVIDAERRFLAHYFGQALDTDPIRIGSSIGRRSWSPYGARISLTHDLFSDRHARSVVRLDDARAASIFAHEALHVWQRQRGRRVTWEGAGLQAGYTLGLFDPYAYDTTIADPDALLEVFVLGNIEQQGRIFQDYVHAELSGGDTERFRRVVDWVRQSDR